MTLLHDRMKVISLSVFICTAATISIATQQARNNLQQHLQQQLEPTIPGQQQQQQPTTTHVIQQRAVTIVTTGTPAGIIPTQAASTPTSQVTVVGQPSQQPQPQRRGLSLTVSVGQFSSVVLKSKGQSDVNTC